MKINNNISAVITNNQLLGTEDSLSNVMEKLSSGLKINHAQDNPSGIAIAGKMQNQIDGLDKASDNSQDAVSLIQTADGALSEVTDMLQRMRELSVQAANGINTAEDLSAIQKEIDSLTDEVDRIASTTEFNGNMLLDGSLNKRDYDESIGALTVQVGANEGQSIDILIADCSSKAIGIADVDVSLDGGPENALDAFAGALDYITDVRSQLGAYQNRLEHTTNSLDTTSENMNSAISRIQDTDMATTMVEYTKYTVLQQAGTSALAQANELPQLALQLLQ